MKKSTLEDFLDIKTKRTPKCNTCIYRKKNRVTMCNKYTWIPASIQEGGHCEKYVAEVD